MLNTPRHRAGPRPLLAGVAAAAACSLAVSGPALAFPAAAAASAQQPAGAPAVSIAITSVSPGYAQPGKTVTVTGTLTNTSSTSMSELTVQLESSGVPFDNRSQLQEYAGGSFGVSTGSVASTDVPGSLAAHAIADWSVSVTANELPFGDGFGVYPLAAEVQNANLSTLSVSRTFLPFWPDTKGLNPVPQQIAWIWPLIDQPQQGACTGLLSNTLASSLAVGGRLAGLLDTGATYPNAHLTWAIDPALLGSVSAMTKSYQVSGPGCPKPVSHPASQAAASWLAQLKAATAGQPLFVTPYDDADIAALVNNNMNTDLTRAFAQGRTVASKVLGRNLSVTAAGPANSMNGTAWPADGVASYDDLGNLAASDGISTVVLASSTMPAPQSVTYTPSAQTKTPDGVGPDLNVLLSDDTITTILGEADSPSVSAGTAFSVRQLYLAETAMIAAERPDLARSVVVAPPRRWDPPPALASGLLQETLSAPWLRTVSLSQLVSSDAHPTGQVSRQPPGSKPSDAELSQPLLEQARHLDQQASLLKSREATPNGAYNSRLDNAVFAVESSAWRGGGTASAAGLALAQQTAAYLRTQEGKVTVSAAPRVTLGGLTGSVPVSVSNGLGFPVRVGLQATHSSLSVRGPHSLVTVPAQQQEIIKIGLNATAVGTTTLQLGLVTPHGVPLSASATINVQATHYGDLALIIIAVALAVFLLTAATRAIRRRPDARHPGGPTGPGGAPSGRDGLAEEAPEPGSVVPGGRPTGQVTAQTSDHDGGEAADDYAWAPGQAERR